MQVSISSLASGCIVVSTLIVPFCSCVSLCSRISQWLSGMPHPNSELHTTGVLLYHPNPCSRCGEHRAAYQSGTNGYLLEPTLIQRSSSTLVLQFDCCPDTACWCCDICEELMTSGCQLVQKLLRSAEFLAHVTSHRIAYLCWGILHACGTVFNV